MDQLSLCGSLWLPLDELPAYNSISSAAEKAAWQHLLRANLFDKVWPETERHLATLGLQVVETGDGAGAAGPNDPIASSSTEAGATSSSSSGGGTASTTPSSTSSSSNSSTPTPAVEAAGLAVPFLQVQADGLTPASCRCGRDAPRHTAPAFRGQRTAAAAAVDLLDRLPKASLGHDMFSLDWLGGPLPVVVVQFVGQWVTITAASRPATEKPVVGVPSHPHNPPPHLRWPLGHRRFLR